MTEDIAVELAVKVDDKSSLARFLEKLNGVRVLSANQLSVTISLNTESELGIGDIQNLIENEYNTTSVVQGVGKISSAVSQLGPSDETAEQIYGVVRISQIGNRRCYVDGIINGFLDSNATYSANIHMYGDLSGRSFENIGEPVINIQDNISLTKGPIDINYEIRLRKEIPNCDVPSMIGRALAITKFCHSVVTAGIVSRASTVEANRKIICTCSGKTIWEERKEVRGDSS